MFWLRLSALIRKELQALLRDPNGRRLLILPVILQIVLFPWAATLEVRNAAIAVLDQDRGAAAVELIQRLDAAEAFDRVIRLTSRQQVAPAIDNQTALIVVAIPEGFSADLAAGPTASVQVIADARRSNAAQIASGYVQTVVQGLGAELRPTSRPDVVVRHWWNPNLDGKWFVIPSLVAIITTLGVLIVTALSVAREREQGTLDQVLVSPLTHGLILAGKAIPALMVATVQATLIILAARLIYRLPFEGSLVLLYVAILLYGLALAGFGLLISAVSQTQQQAFLGAFVFMVPAILLSGFIGPVENMPTVLQWVSWLDPLRHFIVIVKGVFLKGYGLTEISTHLWPLIFIAVATLSAAYGLFRRKVA
ncbi:ABC transporter permease [Brevundimonas sp.]|uniref:ABC transporter permease n=3 Tax=Alphaproteobacteria TaxID=28211 RepID=UPI0028A1A40D|nr:ABC transporter permease [Brevundimonas sp.]